MIPRSAAEGQKVNSRGRMRFSGSTGVLTTHSCPDSSARDQISVGDSSVRAVMAGFGRPASSTNRGMMDSQWTAMM